MAVYTKNVTKAGVAQYRLDGKLVAKEDIPSLVLDKLEIAPEGTNVPADDSIDTDAVPVAEVPENVTTVSIHLEHTLCVNGKAYRGGTELNEDGEEEDVYIDVPADQAEDLKRIDKANSRYEKNLHRGQDLSRKAAGVRVESINAADF